MRAEQDKETSGVHLAMMTSLSGFKLTVSFLFNSATEAMATATRRALEHTCKKREIVEIYLRKFFGIFRKIFG